MEAIRGAERTPLRGQIIKTDSKKYAYLPPPLSLFSPTANRFFVSILTLRYRQNHMKEEYNIHAFTTL